MGCHFYVLFEFVVNICTRKCATTWEKINKMCLEWARLQQTDRFYLMWIFVVENYKKAGHSLQKAGERAVAEKQHFPLESGNVDTRNMSCKLSGIHQCNRYVAKHHIITNLPTEAEHKVIMFVLCWTEIKKASYGVICMHSPARHMPYTTYGPIAAQTNPYTVKSVQSRRPQLFFQ